MSIRINNFHVTELLNQMSEKEKKYATFMALASWAGYPIILKQVSRESTKIFNFVHEFVKSFTDDEINAIFAENTKTNQESNLYQALRFCLAIIENIGNYSGYGDQKILPRISKLDFEKICENRGEKIKNLFDQCKSNFYKYNDLQLGFYPNGCTAYYEPEDFTQEEQKAIDQILLNKGIHLENTKLIRKEDRYEALQYSIDIDKEGTKVGEYNGKGIFLTKGFCSDELKNVNYYLNKAKDYAENENQRKYIELLMESFQTGDINKHLEASKYWVLDSSPNVETQIGFIECYHDPAHVRTEFQGLISTVDKNESKCLQDFVDQSSTILKNMPYPPEYERDTFTKPSYNSLNVLVYPTTMPFVGINVPNYDEIRMKFGFKNVSLDNMGNGTIPSAEQLWLIPDEIIPTYQEMICKVRKIHTATHELYGHGSGTLFSEEDIKNKAIKDILSSDPDHTLVTTFYPEGVTYNKAFAAISSSFEECRAETTALYLTYTDDVKKVFGITDPEQKKKFDLIEAYKMLEAGMNSLASYSPTTLKWTQAHAEGRFCILRAVLIWSRGAARLEENGDSLKIIIDENRLDDVHDAVGKLLKHINYYKATYKPDEAFQFYRALTGIDDRWLSIRKKVNNKNSQIVQHTVYAHAIVKYDENTKEYSLNSPFSSDESPKISDVFHSYLDNIEISQTLY